VRAFFGRTVRAVKIVVRDGRIPRPIRWGGALGLAPVAWQHAEQVDSDMVEVGSQPDSR
jgi:hypothetical protein